MNWNILVLILMILACAVANLGVAVHATRYEHARIVPLTNVRGPAAAAAGWPGRAPLDWPSVSAWSDSRAPAFRHRHAWAFDASDSTSHSRSAQDYGWPLPVLSRTRNWWPDMPPGAAGNPAHDSGLQFRWVGLVVSPVLGGVALWLVLIAPCLLWRALRDSARRRTGRCVGCGYPLGASQMCPECGLAPSKVS